MKKSLLNLFSIYTNLLNASLKSKGITKTLFLARGGLRLKALFNKVYPDSLASSAEFYTSRLAVIKAYSYISPEISAIDLNKEYQGMMMEEMLKAFLGERVFQEYFISSNENLISELRVTPVSQYNINKLIGHDGDTFLRSYLKIQYLLIKEYWTDLVDINDKIALVDTGWSGTIVFYLKQLFPKYNIKAFFVGKTTYGAGYFEYHKDVYGVFFDTSKIVPSQGYSYLVENRHLIEMLCEPNHPSTESYIKVGNHVEPSSGLIKKDVLIGNEYELFRYVYENIVFDPDSLSKGYVKELRALCLYPSRKQVKFFTGVSRSADFGKSIEVDMLNKKGFRLSTKYRNIKSALWKQGQIALEFPVLGRGYLSLYYQVFPYCPWLRRLVK